MDTDQTDHPIADARANLSELLSAVRLLRRGYYLTSRSKRVAALLPVDIGELVDQAGGPGRAAQILRDYLAEAPPAS
ncbi:type II toxin-antitoxin system prevent-host-death family antitoxin [Kitasatospora fiedleri]|uniref:type II toxin-antitoxin system prevent-host-death family antitoxin n=1 Tax=Kitasatospora fiedleri TaxID=2991545 RepID=UPI00249B4C1A|nr:type II toxin-antitoxin system prevent-host-death family antitoxin [Kitasatospora fiedleri]